MKVPERFRVTSGRFATTQASGNNGIFAIKKKKIKIQVIASDGLGWDHVSVTIVNHKRTPTWEEMCYVKELFFNKDEWVCQFHPAESEYVNNHKYCLHLWRPQSGPLQTPLRMMV